MPGAAVATYVRPPPNAGPTRHLYVANWAGTLEELRAAAAAFGPVESVTAHQASKRIAYVSFIGLDAAAKALGALAAARVEYATLLEETAEPDAVPTSPPVAAATRCDELGIPGLVLLLDFVTASEERALVAAVDAPGAEWQHLARRRVQHHGIAFDYCTRGPAVAPVRLLPPWAEAVASRLRVTVPDPDAPAPGYNQLTVNEYEAGVGIAAHVDTHSAFAGSIAALSLLGGCALELRRVVAPGVPGPPAVALWLPPRSLLVYAGEARLAYSHGIPRRGTDLVTADDGSSQPRHRAPRRLSLTFRTVRTGGDVGCACAYPVACDTQGGAVWTPHARVQSRGGGGQGGPPPMERDFVHAVYESIAPHFSATRVAKWPAARAFLAALPPGAVVADVGCGNGKYLGAAAPGAAAVLGCDTSAGLLAVCRASGHCVVVANALQLPYPCSRLDGALCVAVIHHLSTTERRHACLAEIARVLRPGGRALITAWAAEQEDPAATIAKWAPLPGSGGGYLVPWHLPVRRAEGAAAARHLPPSTRLDGPKAAVVFQRYYHLFAAGELEAAVATVPGLTLVGGRCDFDHSNWVALCEKT